MLSSLSEYLNELDEKIKRARKASAGTSKIGIFWLCFRDGKIKVFFSIVEDLEFGVNYGHFTISTKEHYVIWNSLVNNGIAPKSSNYEDLPRGRIAYDKNTNEYVVFHGNYIRSSRKIKSVIKSEFNLKSNVRWEPDLHYNGFKTWGF